MAKRWIFAGLASLLAVLAAAAWLIQTRPGEPEPPGSPAMLDLAQPITRVAIGSCADQNLPQPIWTTIAGTKPDVFVFMGDNVYGDVSGEDPALPELRAAYDRFAKLEAFARFRETVPVLAIWDDHDYGVNDGGRDFPLKAQSKALFAKFWGIEATSPRLHRDGLYDSVTVGPEGQRVQIILLDTRWFRDPLKATDQRDAPGKERYLPDRDPIRTMLGAEQWAWLEGELKRPAELRLIVSSIQVIADGHGWERWGNLPRERTRLFELIAQTGAGGVIFLSGDRHIGALYRSSDGTPYPFYELTASSLNRPATTITDEAGPNRLGPIFNRENFGLITVDWAHHTVRLELKDAGGDTVLPLSVPLATLAVSPEAAHGR